MNLLLIRTVAAAAAALAAAFAAAPALGEARDTVHIVGSSTVYPFSSAVAERFGKEEPGGDRPEEVGAEDDDDGEGHGRLREVSVQSRCILSHLPGNCKEAGQESRCFFPRVL